MVYAVVMHNGDCQWRNYGKQWRAAASGRQPGGGASRPVLKITLLKVTLSMKLADVKTIKELAEFLLIKHAELSSTFSEVITACILYLTLPVTVASAERSFSKLKLIKTYLRSTMCQVRLSSLGMLSIESQRLNDLNVEEIIDIFADTKARRKLFV